MFKQKGGETAKNKKIAKNNFFQNNKKAIGHINNK